MDNDKFAVLVANMRHAQKVYFNTERGEAKQNALRQALRLEKLVDDQLAELYVNGTAQHPKSISEEEQYDF